MESGRIGDKFRNFHALMILLEAKLMIGVYQYQFKSRDKLPIHTFN